MKAPAKWALRVALALAVGLVALEAGLRIVGFAYAVLHARGGGAGARAIVCLGDSHTFGIWLAKEDAYPARLGARLAAANPTDPPPVENAGVPGYASSDALARLRERLAGGPCAAVLVMVGANDRWKGVERAWWEDLRVVKVVKLAFQKPAPPRVADTTGVVTVSDIAGRPTPGTPNEATVSLVDRSGAPVAFQQKTSGEVESDAALDAKLSASLRAIERAAAGAGARCVFVGYPSEANDLGIANRAMAAAAHGAGAPFVDLAPAFAAARARHPFEALYFPDHHATAAGNELVARVVADALAEAGVAGAAPPAGADSAPSDRFGRWLLELPIAAPREAPLALEGSLAGGLTLLCATEPGREVHFFLSFSEGTTDVLGHRVPLGRDLLFERTVDPKNPTRTRVVAGADGQARLRLDAPLLGGVAPGARLLAAAAIFGRPGEPGLHDLTPAKAFELR